MTSSDVTRSSWSAPALSADQDVSELLPIGPNTGTVRGAIVDSSALDGLVCRGSGQDSRSRRASRPLGHPRGQAVGPPSIACGDGDRERLTVGPAPELMRTGRPEGEDMRVASPARAEGLLGLVQTRPQVRLIALPLGQQGGPLLGDLLLGRGHQILRARLGCPLPRASTDSSRAIRARSSPIGAPSAEGSGGAVSVPASGGRNTQRSWTNCHARSSGVPPASNFSTASTLR